MNKWNKFIAEGELKTVGIVACLNDKQQFLVIRRSNVDDRGGQWTIPGGHIDDKDNSIEAGAVRELEEEAGLICKTSDLVFLGTPKPDKHMFLTQKWSGEVNVDKPNPKTGDNFEHTFNLTECNFKNLPTDLNGQSEFEMELPISKLKLFL